MNHRYDRRFDHDGGTDSSRARPGTGMGLALMAVGAGTFLVARNLADGSPAQGGRYSGTAPAKALRRYTSQMREGTLVGRTVTIRRPREELYAF